MVHKEFATILPNAATGLREPSTPLAADNATGPSRLNGTVVIDMQGPAASEETGRDSDDDIVEEVVNAFLAELADSARHTGLEHPSANLALDTIPTSLPTLPVPRTPDNADGSTGRTLRKRPQLSYREPSGRGPNPKQSRPI